ncbi:alpha/beta fold hydrolase [Tomitella fengzijianii]|uniref:alpha/beta fold hydrolase n=1 Tax=Tomitella fengzijianii TaxID=2597660 RepID=UPI0038B52631
MAGPEDGETVLLLHGFPESYDEWRAVAPLLAAAGLRVIAPDQRGYSPGARPPAVEDYRIDRLVADAAGILDHFGAGRAHVVGHDWGASVAWTLAARHPSAPGGGSTRTIRRRSSTPTRTARTHPDSPPKRPSGWRRSGRIPAAVPRPPPPAGARQVRGHLAAEPGAAARLRRGARGGAPAHRRRHRQPGAGVRAGRGVRLGRAHTPVAPAGLTCG